VPGQGCRVHPPDRGQLFGRHGIARSTRLPRLAQRGCASPCYKHRNDHRRTAFLVRTHPISAMKPYPAMSHEILINVNPAGNPRRDARTGRRAGAPHGALQRAGPRRAIICLGPYAARAARNAERIRRNRSRARRLPAHRRHLGTTGRTDTAAAISRPDREDPARGPVAAGAG